MGAISKIAPILDKNKMKRIALAKGVGEQSRLCRDCPIIKGNSARGGISPLLTVITAFILILMGVCHTPLYAFELRYHHDSSGQRRDGTKLFDITYELYDLGATDSVNIFVWAVTQSGETLAYCTPTDTDGTFSGAIGTIHGPGIKHILWNIGLDQPDREFYSDSIMIYLSAGMSGWAPGSCGTAAIAGGGRHTIALKADGTVWACGLNNYGQLGDGTNTSRNTPVQVVGPDSAGFLTDIIAIAGGWAHTIVLKNDGTVWAFGWNSKGQLGDGTTASSSTPVQVRGEGGVGFLTDIIAIAAGGGYDGGHTVALKSDGTVWTYGWNNRGQLGDGTTTERHTPVQVHGEDDVGFLTDIIAIAAGYRHTVALKSDRTVWAYGLNYFGQLGDGTGTDRHTPVQTHGEGDIGFLTDIIAIAAGYSHTVALKSDGTVWAYGRNYFGQLGDGTTATTPPFGRATPVQVHGEGDVGFLTDIIAIAAGGDGHTVALKSDGTVWTFGYNGWGQLGDNTSTDSHTPVQVHGEGDIGNIEDMSAIAAGRYHTISLRTDGTVWTFGRNTEGQLGDGTWTDSWTPVMSWLPW